MTPAASRRRDAACGLLRAATLVATLLAGMLPASDLLAQPDAPPAVPAPPQAPPPCCTVRATHR